MWRCNTSISEAGYQNCKRPSSFYIPRPSSTDHFFCSRKMTNGLSHLYKTSPFAKYFYSQCSYMLSWLAEEAVQTGIFICILERTSDRRDKIGEVVQIGVFICTLERTLDQRHKAACPCTQLYLFAERKQHLNTGLLGPVHFAVSDPHGRLTLTSK